MGAFFFRLAQTGSINQKYLLHFVESDSWQVIDAQPTSVCCIDTECVFTNPDTTPCRINPQSWTHTHRHTYMHTHICRHIDNMPICIQFDRVVFILHKHNSPALTWYSILCIIQYFALNLCELSKKSSTNRIHSLRKWISCWFPVHSLN